jgi:ribose 5-phosphate isomerase B
MKIAFGTDHGGFEFKEQIIGLLKSLGHDVVDCGCFSNASCDYPDFGYAVACLVSKGDCDKGVLICGTGVGISISANKLPGIRAAVCYSDEVAKLISEHNDANIICLSGRMFTIDVLLRWIKTWITTPFSNEPRHVTRINKIKQIETRVSKGECK